MQLTPHHGKQLVINCVELPMLYSFSPQPFIWTHGNFMGFVLRLSTCFGIEAAYIINTTAIHAGHGYRPRPEFDYLTSLRQPMRWPSLWISSHSAASPRARAAKLRSCATTDWASEQVALCTDSRTDMVSIRNVCVVYTFCYSVVLGLSLEAYSSSASNPKRWLSVSNKENETSTISSLTKKF